MLLYVDLADELLAHTQSEDEQPDVDVAKQQRLLEQENEGDDENVSDSGTLTPGRDKMDIDETGSGSEKTGSTSEDKGDSLLKSQSPPTVLIAATALEPALLTAPPPLPARREAQLSPLMLVTALATPWPVSLWALVSTVTCMRPSGN